MSDVGAILSIEDFLKENSANDNAEKIEAQQIEFMKELKINIETLNERIKTIEVPQDHMGFTRYQQLIAKSILINEISAKAVSTMVSLLNCKLCYEGV